MVGHIMRMLTRESRHMHTRMIDLEAYLEVSKCIIPNGANGKPRTLWEYLEDFKMSLSSRFFRWWEFYGET